MRAVLIIVLVAVAGCSSSLTGPPLPPETGRLTYFWPDSAATYRYSVSVGGDVHTITVLPGGAVTDQDQNSGTTTNLTITRSNSDCSMSGFGSNDFLGLQPWQQIVQDTVLLPQRLEYIHSIAAVNPFFGGASGTLYAATDSLLYKVDLSTNVLTSPEPLPIPGLRLAEDVSGAGIYAFDYGGRGIFWTTNGGATWASDSTPPGTAITAFTSAYNVRGDHFWVACGSQLFDFSFGNPTGTLVPCSLDKITSLEASPANADIIAAGSSGKVYDVSRSKLMGTAPAGVHGIAANYISTDSGIYDFTRAGLPILPVADSAIYFTGLSIVAARPDGSIDRFSATTQNVNIPAPNPGFEVIQFAYPDQGTHDPNRGIYALAGGRVYYQSATQSWVAVSSMVSSNQALRPGSLKLLEADTGTWIAGYIESNHHGVQNGYAYSASAPYPFSEVVLDGGSAIYYDVLIVTYSTKSNGVADAENIPQYVIYYEKNKGPFRIERTYNGKTVVIRRQ